MKLGGKGSDVGDALQSAIDQAIKALAVAHEAREHGIQASRETIQISSRAIRAAHRGEMDLARRLVGEAQEAIQISDSSNDAPIFNTGYLLNGEKEYAEAALTVAFLSDDPIPDADGLGVSHAAYLNGLAEAASELRRSALDAIRRGDVARADHLLSYMDSVMAVLAQVDFPEGVTGGLRRTTDQLRGVTERTRGDVTQALRQTSLEQKLSELADKLRAE